MLPLVQQIFSGIYHLQIIIIQIIFSDAGDHILRTLSSDLLF